MPNLSQFVNKKTSCLKKRIYDTCTIESNICQWWFLGLVIALQLWLFTLGNMTSCVCTCTFCWQQDGQTKQQIKKKEHLWVLGQKIKHAYNKKIF